MVYHAKKRCIVIGYPEADEAPRNFFCLKSEETFEIVFDRFLLFLEKLFIAVNHEVLKNLPAKADSEPLPVLWYNHLLQDGNRNRREIYKEVATKASEVSHSFTNITLMILIVE